MTRQPALALGAVCAIALGGAPIAAAVGSPHHDTASRHMAPSRHHHHVRAEASTAGDGPHVVNANDFTTGHRGLKPGQIEMTTVDARPTLIAGHHAKLAIRGLSKHDNLQVVVDGQAIKVHRIFRHVRSRPGQARGAVEGVIHLPSLGHNVVTATARDHRYGRRSVTLHLLAHSIQGPILTGPHQEPFVCQTAEQGMGAPHGSNCVAKRRVHWWYKDKQGSFHRLTKPFAPYPKSTASTTIHGKRVPFVLRVENVVINRSVTRLAVLDDPHKRGRHKPFQPREWNHNLVWHFGESCGTGFHQGSDGGEISVFSPLDKISGDNIAGPFLNLPGLLSHGYMVGESSLTIFGVHCNQVLSAETLMMVKQFVTDRYGDVHHVTSGGASGGAIQQYTIANGYPGILDGGTPLLSFPDVVSTAMTVGDCVLLRHYFGTHKDDFSTFEQNDVTGLADPQVCIDWDNLFGDNLHPTSCPGGVDPATIYNRKTNPDGVRCDLQDDLVNLLGRSRATGKALRPLDNVGVQYGLVALRRGQITAQQFVDLNRGVGGVNLNGGFVSGRQRMSRREAHRMFANSMVGEYGAIDQAAIIDQTIPVSDDVPELDIHDQIRPYEVRARLDANFGSHRSQVIWSGAALPSSAIVAVNRWLNALDALQADHPWKPRAWLVAHSRPSDLTDACRIGGAGAPASCSVAKHAGPRQKAGGPLSEDVIKCRLRPLRRAAYPSSMTAAQFRSLKKIFPGGVCDYAKKSVGSVSRSRTWVSFGDKHRYDKPQVIPYPLVRSRVPRQSAG